MNDTELITLLRSGDRGAYTEIYRRYKGILLIHAYKKLGDFEEAKDIVQETFSFLWKDRDEIPDTKNLAGFLYTVVRNKILNYIEHKKVESKYASSFIQFIADENHLTDFLIREKELVALIDKEINALPEKMKEVFVLSRKGNLSHKEIADKLNISVFTVKNHIKSALKTLRPKFELLIMVSILLNLY
ncbi:RNA polymerase sigma-70 factor, ECF subfamily [Mucilaginibacter lappiensis]|uniref:RNA polymerase sigma-70 factor (ECF subfamily) n=1 Tax=Mucilaginibacter lappiensis TaxID=354630 RepID=A0ABR6PHG2_9SPHI|nr:RNA polymerase sigma-70 factor [Mucilaginibacter lappiensis]MBB6109204.1 RNA polymerase sigma-70 factor (ECF subfamily) [Mucilaginibacter lappiensis]SIQ79940.1 RNA polymerase sigma-70 factor, ECF subfamily [Mucilaginibacter lappiensis]